MARRMGWSWGDVVAVGDEDEAGERVEAAGDEAQEVEGGLVGPLQVFEHEHGRADGGAASSARKASNTWRLVAGRRARRRADRAWSRAMSASGPSGRGANRSSQRPTQHPGIGRGGGRAAPAREPTCPTPASPLTSTRCPPRSRSAYRSTTRAIWSARSEQPHQRQGYDERAVGASGSGRPPVAGPVERGGCCVIGRSISRAGDVRPVVATAGVVGGRRGGGVSSSL